MMFHYLMLHFLIDYYFDNLPIVDIPNSKHAMNSGQNIFVPNVTAFFKLPPNSGHLPIRDKARRYLLFSQFTVFDVALFNAEYSSLQCYAIYCPTTWVDVGLHSVRLFYYRTTVWSCTLFVLRHLILHYFNVALYYVPVSWHWIIWCWII